MNKGFSFSSYLLAIFLEMIVIVTKNRKIGIYPKFFSFIIKRF